MARPRKTFISDAYAERQARFACLGVAVITRPLRRCCTFIADSLFPKGPQTTQDVDTLRRAFSPFVRAAERGNGKVLASSVRAFAAR
jgi:hypothetical protein